MRILSFALVLVLRVTLFSYLRVYYELRVVAGQIPVEQKRLSVDGEDEEESFAIIVAKHLVAKELA